VSATLRVGPVMECGLDLIASDPNELRQYVHLQNYYYDWETLGFRRKQRTFELAESQATAPFYSPGRPPRAYGIAPA